MAPEVLSGKKRHLHSGIDIWAMGCMLYEMLCGKWAFNGENQKKMVDHICRGRFSFQEFKYKLSPEVKDLICKMLEVDPAKRATMYNVLSHPWMSMKKSQTEGGVKGPVDAPKQNKGMMGSTILKKIDHHMKIIEKAEKVNFNIFIG